MTFDVHNPDGSVKKQTYKNGSDLNDPIIETPLAPARPVDDFADIAKPAGYTPPTDTTSKPSAFSWEPLSEDERNKITSVFGKTLGAGVTGLANTALGAASGASQLILHPLNTIYGSAQTAADALNQMFPDSTLNPQQKKAKDASLARLKDQWEAIKDNPDYAIGNLAGSILGGKVVGEAVGPITKKLQNTVESARKGTQSLVGAGERVVKEKVATEANNANTAAEKTEAANRAAVREHGKTVEETDKANLKTHMEHQVEKANVENMNKAAEAIPDSRAGLENYAKEKVEEADVRTEKARHDALDVGNEKYNGVNEALNRFEPDPVQFRRKFAEAADTLSDQRGKMPPVMKDLEDRINGTDASGRPNPPINYDELQKFYSRLGNELSKGTLDGETFHAYDVMHDAIGEDMQKIADEHGQGAALKDARQYWRRMKQTFGKSSDTINNRAGKAVNAAGPDVIDAQETEYRHRLLGSFDPEIPKLLKDAQSARDRLAKLPSEKEAMGMKRPVPAYPEGNTVEPPKLGRVEVPELSTSKIRADLIDKWARGETGLSKFQVARLVGSAGIGTVIGAVFGHGLGAEVGSAASAISYALSPSIVAKLLSRPAVVEWLTRPPAGELETLQKLPNADRIKITDGLAKVAAQAQKQGVRVSPQLLAIIATTGSPKGPVTRKLESLRDGQPDASDQ